MPDRSDVEASLAALVASVLYPDGTESPSPLGVESRVYRGWPVPKVLEAELRQGAAHVTVQPVAGSTRDRTRFADEWQGASPAPTLSVAVEGEVATFSGAGGPGHVAGVRVDGRAYAYRMREGDTASLVAAALAASVRADRPALAVGSSLNIPQASGLLARVVTDGVGGRELRRQEARFRLTFWCPSAAARDDMAGAVDCALADTLFIDVGGWACRLELAGDSSTDEGAAGGLWRRDLIYSVEYPTTVAETLPAMLFGIADVNGVPHVG